MTEHEWELLMSKINGIESDVKDVKREMGTLKVKVAAFASFIGAIVGSIFK